jgi:uncharacterized Zn-binding protein involved in type VI secretion
MKKKFLAVLGAVIIAGGIITGCGTEVEDVGSGSTGTEQKEEKPKEEAKDKVYKNGETVKVDGLEITITGAKFTDPAEYSPASKGKVLTIDLATTNTSDTQAFIDSTDFNIYDSEGNQLEAYYGYNDMAISGDVNKGKKLAGKIYFDVPEQGSYELIYTPTFALDSTEIKFEVTPQ